MAKAVVSLINRPQNRTAVGAFPHFLRLSYRLFPALTRNITASLIQTYLKKAEVTKDTSGNVLQPVDYGRGIDGGWRTTSLKPDQKQKMWLVAAIAAGIVLLGRK